MPTYDYVCAACGHALEIFQSMSESPKKKCPKCGKSKLERRIGAGAGFLFKGSGFYLTDYRSKAYTAAARSEAERDTATSGQPATDKPAPTPSADASAKPAPVPKSEPTPQSESASKSAAKKSAPSPSAKKRKS